MANLGLRIAGGILSGVGKTITDQANARFEAALKQVEMEQNDQYKARDEERQHGYRMKEGEVGFGQEKEKLGLQHTNRLGEIGVENAGRRGLLSKTVTDADGNVYSVSGGGDVRDLGIRSAPNSMGDVVAPILQKVRDGKPLTKGEQAALDRYKTPSLDAQAYSFFGNEGASGGSLLDDKSPGAMPSRSTPSTPSAQKAAAPSSPAKSLNDAAQSPPGQGTTSNPYRARSQADVEWFKKNAKPGDKIKAPDGSIYTR